MTTNRLFKQFLLKNVALSRPVFLPSSLKYINSSNSSNDKFYARIYSTATIKPSLLAKTPNRTYDYKYNRLKILTNPDILELKARITSLITLNSEYERIFEEILKTHTKPIKNLRSIRNLKSKLRFKLGWIINCIRRLTNISNKRYLNETMQFKLAKSILTHLTESNKNMVSSDKEEIDEDSIDLEEEMEFEMFFNLKDSFKGLDDYFNLNSISNKLGPNASIIDKSLDNIEDFEMSITSSSLEDKDLTEETNEIQDLLNSYEIFGDNPIKSLIESKNKSDFDTLLSNYGADVTEIFENKHVNSNMVDYSEDILGSIEREIEEKAADLRIDFPNIDDYIHELRLLIGKEWLAQYEESHLKRK